MTVKFMIGVDQRDERRENQYGHEFDGVRKICDLLWDKLHALETVFYVIRNPSLVVGEKTITPDMIILSQLGLGVVELKNDAYKIHWKPKNANKEPHFKQVQRYGQAIWNALLEGEAKINLYASQTKSDQLKSTWLPYTHKLKKQLKLFTTICYTNKTADLSDCLKWAAQRPRKGEDAEADWEYFSIITPAEIPTWAANLRWGVDLGKDNRYRAYQLTAEEVDILARNFFNAQDDPDIEKLVTGVREVHAFLKWIDYPDLKPERLDRDQYILGRYEKTSDIQFPEENPRLSNEHLRLTFLNGRYYIEDLSSTNGTYLPDGTRLQGKQEIVFEQSVSCGGKRGPNVRKFKLVKPPDKEKKRTEKSTDIELVAYKKE